MQLLGSLDIGFRLPAKYEFVRRNVHVGSKCRAGEGLTVLRNGTFRILLNQLRPRKKSRHSDIVRRFSRSLSSMGTSGGVETDFATITREPVVIIRLSRRPVERPLYPDQQTSSAWHVGSEKCQKRKSVDLSSPRRTHTSSTRYLGIMRKRPTQVSSSSSYNMAPIVIRSRPFSG